jgi:hypothetical protein
MSLFGIETNRLVRVKWQPEMIDDLAQEIYSLLSGKNPMFIDAPVRINPTDGSTPLTITMPDDNTTTPAVTINNGGVEQTFGGNTEGDVTYGGITFNTPDTGIATPPTGGTGGTTGGGPDLGDIDYPSGPPDPAAIPAPSENPIVLYGEVNSKIDGNRYSVRCWAKDPLTSLPIATLEVYVAGLDPTEELTLNHPMPVIVFPSSGGIGRAIGFVDLFFPPV